MLKSITLPGNEKRVITEKKEWKEIKDTIDTEIQYEYIEKINEISKTKRDLIYKELKKKISSYRTQDKTKKLYDKEQFVDLETVMELLNACKMCCYYCKANVLILYENLREPKQWTLERLDNNYGHNKGNLEISCLKCNVDRKTMYYERFMFTKELKIIKTE
jgi:hypothetical protein